MAPLSAQSARRQRATTKRQRVDEPTLAAVRQLRKRGVAVHLYQICAIATGFGLLELLKDEDPSLAPFDDEHGNSAAAKKARSSDMTALKKTYNLTWASRIVRDNGMSIRRGTTKHVVTAIDENRVNNFLTRFAHALKLFRPPDEFVLAMDQTPLPLTATQKTTVEATGSANVPITGFNDKRQITGQFAQAATGELLKPQFIFNGADYSNLRQKPARDHDGRALFAATPDHRADDRTMEQWINDSLGV
jgi:hypothetical protein